MRIVVGKCRRCKRYEGACVCEANAAQHRAGQVRRKEPTVCGQRFGRSGGTCHATAPCGRDHSRY